MLPPNDLVGRLFSLEEVRQFGRLFALVEELIERAFECASHLFQRFDGRDSMTIFYAGYITTKQARTLFDVALGEFLFLAHFAEAVANNHGALLHSRKCPR